jgi:hypothetical protein
MTVGPVELLHRLADACSAHGAAINALGGVGVSLRAGALPESLQREHGDLDVVVRRSERRQVEAALAETGLVPDELFNRMNGHRRQVWWTAEGDDHVDVFLGRFDMCHDMDLEARVDPTHRALPATDLLLTKLQVVEINAKDVRDAGALLWGIEISEEDEPGVISTRRLADVLGGDWGFFTTVQDNLTRVPDQLAALAAAEEAPVRVGAERIMEALEAAPKTRAWRMRARIGRRKRWYTLPDESLDDDEAHGA